MLAPYKTYKTGELYLGDCREILKQMTDGSVDCVVTSPPYWGLRDYGIEPTVWGGDDENCEHQWGEDIIPKGKSNWDTIEWNDGRPKNASAGWKEKVKNTKANSQGSFCTLCSAWRGTLGLEPHPSMFITHLVDIFREVRRVLKDTGAIFVNLGDSYCSIGGQRQDKKKYGGKSRIEDLRARLDSGLMDGNWLQPKQLLGLPERFMIAMQEDGWCLRNKIIWYKRNPMPSSVKDRFNNVYEYVYFFVKKSKGYYFDLDAVREEHNSNAPKIKDINITGEKWKNVPGQNSQFRDNHNLHSDGTGYNPAGKNPGDIFHLSTFPYPGAHFATFPLKLIEKPIEACVPKWICKQCGQARVRVTEKGNLIPDEPKYKPRGRIKTDNLIQTGMTPAGTIKPHPNFHYENNTIGWTVCSCNNPEYEPGIVCDPFGGSGTVGVQAIRSDVGFILIDAKQEYCDMQIKRIEPEIEKKQQGEMFK